MYQPQTKNLFNSSLYLLVLLIWCAFSYILSYNIGKIQGNIEISNNIVSFIIKMNNFTSLILPLLLFVFYFLSSKLMLNIFDIKIKSRELMNTISFGFIPIIVSLIFTCIIIYVNAAKLNNISSYEDIGRVPLFYNFNLNDFKLLNDSLWVFFYLITLIIYNEKYRISIKNSIAISLSPTIIILIFKILFSYGF